MAFSLWCYSKDEATNSNADTVDTNDFNFFHYKAKLLGNTEADERNGISKQQLITQQMLCH